MTDISRRRGLTFATLIALIALATLAAALTGCTVGPDFVRPDAPHGGYVHATPAATATRAISPGAGVAETRAITLTRT
jgi:hypothetical protein